MIIHIKNMVSNRCITAVQFKMDQIGLRYKHVALGLAELYINPTPKQHELLRVGLLDLNLELLTDKTTVLIEMIKHIIIEMVRETSYIPKTKTSVYISEKSNYDYTYLATVFSKETGVTIEHYIINHKIEKVKELIIDNELSLKEIAFLLNYSSVSHLSHQFKQVSGSTASSFRNSATQRRISIEDI